MNSAVRPFLMKVLLKKRFVGLVNSARDPLEKLKHASQKKKKKNRRKCAETISKRYLNLKIYLNLLVSCGLETTLEE